MTWRGPTLLLLLLFFLIYFAADEKYTYYFGKQILEEVFSLWFTECVYDSFPPEAVFAVQPPLLVVNDGSTSNHPGIPYCLQGNCVYDAEDISQALSST